MYKSSQLYLPLCYVFIYCNGWKYHGLTPCNDLTLTMRRHTLQKMVIAWPYVGRGHDIFGNTYGDMAFRVWPLYKMTIHGDKNKHVERQNKH